MLLKRLELNGFKSFAGKTVLEFPTGVTAIVGPNGSGKSNVIDAIRWLLGEREAKQLRGGKVEDLIFGGTEGRGKSTLASGTLVFDNSSKFFPLEFDEVEIKREITRDGNSAYYINKSEVRLKDVVEILSQSRLGTKGIIVITQGNSDLFIKATPQERRDMIEEILGLREFRLKKMEAERKLKGTGFNIEKVQALIEEILPHLRLLRRQTVKWEKRADLLEELKGLEDKYFTTKATRLEKEYLTLDPTIADLETKIGVMGKELRELMNNLGGLERSEPEDRAELAKIRKEREEIDQTRRKKERELGEIEIKLAITEREVTGKTAEVNIDGLISLFKKIYKEAGEIVKSGYEEVKMKVLLKKIVDNGKEVWQEESENRTNLKELQEKKDKLKEEVDDLIEKGDKLGRAGMVIEKKLTEFTIEFRKAFSLVEAKKEAIAEHESVKNRHQLDKEKWGIKIQDLKEHIRQAGRSWDEFIRGGGKEVMTREELEEAERKIFKLRGLLAALGEVDEALVKEAKDTEERYEFLSKQMEDLQKATKDLKEVIADLSLKIHHDFNEALKNISQEFEKTFKAMFGGGKAKLIRQTIKEVEKTEEGELLVEGEEVKEKYKDLEAGVEIDVNMPNKKISGLDVLSGGERSLVSIAGLFALISVSPPPFLVLDEIDAPLDENNAIRFAKMIKDFSAKVQFVVVTHNRSTMEVADVLYGVTLGDDGASKILSLKMSD